MWRKGCTWVSKVKGMASGGRFYVSMRDGGGVYMGSGNGERCCILRRLLQWHLLELPMGMSKLHLSIDTVRLVIPKQAQIVVSERYNPSAPNCPISISNSAAYNDEVHGDSADVDDLPNPNIIEE